MEKKRIENEAYCRYTSERPFFENHALSHSQLFYQWSCRWDRTGGASGAVRTRYMKGNMNEADFKAWAVKVTADRDAAIEQITPTIDAVLRIWIIERLRKRLDQQ